MAMTSLTPLVRTDPTFKADVDTFFATDLPLFVTEANALETNVNAKEATASAAAVDAANQVALATTQAGIATASANSAAASANFKGEWSTLTGALNIPASVSVSGVVYMLLQNIADVTASNPTSTPADWASLSVIVTGVGGTTASGNVVLTDNSDGAQYITTTAHGQSVTLPDATTCAKGALLFSIHNGGNHDLALKNNSGTTIRFIRPNTSVSVGLADNATAVGTWTVRGGELLGLVGVKAFSSATTTMAICDYFELDADREFFLFRTDTPSTLNGIVYNKTTQTWGSATAIRSGVTSSSQASAIKTATDQVLVVSAITTAFEAVVLSITGTTITVNTAATATLAGAISDIGTASSSGKNGWATIGSTFVFRYNRDTTISAVRGIIRF